MNRTESAITAYLNHYKRIAVSDMVEYFGYQKDRREQQDLNKVWNLIFAKHGHREKFKPKVVDMPNIEYYNAKIAEVLK